MSVDAARARPLAMAHVRPRRRRGRGRPRRARARDRPRARLRHGRHDDRRVPDRRRRGRDGARSGSSATTRCGCPCWPSSPSARAAARIARGGRGVGRAQGGPAERGRGARARRPTAGAARAPTVTDANVVLGYLNPGAGLRRLHPHRPRPGRSAALAPIGAAPRPLARSTPRTAWWRSPTRACCARCAWSPCSAATTCAASPSSPTAARARSTRARSRGRRGSSRVVVPAHSGAFSALGCLVSPLRYDAVQTYRAPARRLGRQGRRGPLPRARGAVPARRSLEEGHAADRCSCSGASTCATPGRTTRSTLPFGGGDPAALRAAFERAAPPALRLRHGREHRVREPARGGDRLATSWRTGASRGRDPAPPALRAPRCRRDRIARVLPRDGRGHAAPLRPRRAARRRRRSPARP